MAPNPTKNTSRHASRDHLLDNKCVFHRFLLPGWVWLDPKNDLRDVCATCAGRVRDASKSSLMFVASRNWPDRPPDDSRELLGHVQGTLRDDFGDEFLIDVLLHSRWNFQKTC